MDAPFELAIVRGTDLVSADGEIGRRVVDRRRTRRRVQRGRRRVVALDVSDRFGARELECLIAVALPFGVWHRLIGVAVALLLTGWHSQIRRSIRCIFGLFSKTRRSGREQRKKNQFRDLTFSAAPIVVIGVETEGTVSGELGNVRYCNFSLVVDVDSEVVCVLTSSLFAVGCRRRRRRRTKIKVTTIATISNTPAIAPPTAPPITVALSAATASCIVIVSLPLLVCINDADDIIEPSSGGNVSLMALVVDFVDAAVVVAVVVVVVVVVVVAVVVLATLDCGFTFGSTN